jgi:FkbM family methyltransferase
MSLDIDKLYQEAKFINEKDELLNDFDRRVEEGSQYLVKKYIKPDMRILELGARYGTVSFWLNYMLNDPSKQLLCVDPDYKIWNALTENRDNNGCSFNIFKGAVSSKELYLVDNNNPWENKTYGTPHDKYTSTKIPTATIEEIKSIYEIDFNVLLADCEGFLLEFMNENEDFIKDLDIVIYEEDCGKNHPINGIAIDYSLIENKLKEYGFECIEKYRDKIGLDNLIWKKK